LKLTSIELLWTTGGCCDWKGWQGFQQYVYLSVVAYNLLVLARLRLPT